MDAKNVNEGTESPGTEPGGRRGLWIAVILIGGVAIFLRVCNLGTFSLWWDEVFTMKVAALPLHRTLATCARDAENVPLYAVVANLGLRMGLKDPWIRVLPIAAGVASILLLAVWTNRQFGRTTALLVMGFCAVSAFHIRYSQELRAYPYLLLICTLTLIVADRLRVRPDWPTTCAFAATAAVGFYTNLTYLLVLVPVAGLILHPQEPQQAAHHVARARAKDRFLVGVSLGLLAFVPWLWLTSRVLLQRMSRPQVTDWTWELVGRRWQALTIAGQDTEQLTWFGGLLAGFAFIGLAVTLAKGIGRAVFLPALVILLAWEVFLAAVGHWSAARYNTALWPFIAVIVALGFQRVLQCIRWRWLQGLACCAVVVMFLPHVDNYHRNGRHHWDLLATAVETVRRDGEVVVTVDNWTRFCVGYYLGERVASIDEQSSLLANELAEFPSVILVTRQPRPKMEILRTAETRAEITRVHRTGRVYRLRGVEADKAKKASVPTAGQQVSWPAPVDELVPDRVEERPVGCFSRLLGGPARREISAVRRLEFDSGTRPFMRSGWARPSIRADGTTLAWVLGREASVDLNRSVPTRVQIAIRLRPNREIGRTQSMRLLLNGHELGVRRLRQGFQVVKVVARSRFWCTGRNLLVLQFAEVCCQDDVRGSRPVGGSRAAAVDWIELLEKQPVLRQSRHRGPGTMNP